MKEPHDPLASKSSAVVWTIGAMSLSELIAIMLLRGGSFDAFCMYAVAFAVVAFARIAAVIAANRSVGNGGVWGLWISYLTFVAANVFILYSISFVG